MRTATDPVSDVSLYSLFGSIHNGTEHGLRVRLSDELLDLDQPITVFADRKQVFSGAVKRDGAVITATLRERLDPASAACAEIVIEL